MRVRDFMSTPTMTISPTASVIEARDGLGHMKQDTFGNL